MMLCSQVDQEYFPITLMALNPRQIIENDLPDHFGGNLFFAMIVLPIIFCRIFKVAL